MTFISLASSGTLNTPAVVKYLLSIGPTMIDVLYNTYTCMRHDLLFSARYQPLVGLDQLL